MIRRNIACLLVMLVAVPVVVPPAAAGQQPSDSLEALFARGRAVQKWMRSIRASFRQTTVSSLLVKPLTSTGTVIAAVHPLRLVMHYEPPDGRTVWIDEKWLVVRSPRSPSLEQIDIADTQRRIEQYFTNASLDDLKSSFEMALRDDPVRPTAHLLEMTPKRSQIKQGLDRMRLWIDMKTLLMVRLEMTSPGGDSTTIDLADIEVNVPIDERTFARSGKGLRP